MLVSQGVWVVFSSYESVGCFACWDHSKAKTKSHAYMICFLFCDMTFLFLLDMFMMNWWIFRWFCKTHTCLISSENHLKIIWTSSNPQLIFHCHFPYNLWLSVPFFKVTFLWGGGSQGVVRSLRFPVMGDGVMAFRPEVQPTMVPAWEVLQAFFFFFSDFGGQRYMTSIYRLHNIYIYMYILLYIYMYTPEAHRCKFIWLSFKRWHIICDRE